MTRSDLIELMALSDALFDRRVRSALTELGRADRQRYQDRAEASLDAIGTVAAVVARSVAPLALAAGWKAINAGRAKPVDISPGPALAEAWPAMVRAVDLTQAENDHA